LLSLLLVTVLVAGGCLSCEQFFMVPSAKTCCAADGHCKTKAPSKQTNGPECKRIAFDDHKAFDTHVELPSVAIVPVELTLTSGDAGVPPQAGDAAWPPGPDLQVLHSTFLI